MKGLEGLVDGKHYFDMFAEDATFESRYHFPGWPVTVWFFGNRWTTGATSRVACCSFEN
jgi:hypothetical protein